MAVSTALATVDSRTHSGQLDTACCLFPWPLDLNAVTFQLERLSQGPLLIPKLLSWLLWLLGALVSTAPCSPPLQGLSQPAQHPRKNHFWADDFPAVTSTPC